MVVLTMIRFLACTLSLVFRPKKSTVHNSSQTPSALPPAFQLAPASLATTTGVKSACVPNGQMTLYGIAAGAADWFDCRIATLHGTRFVCGARLVVVTGCV